MNPITSRTLILTALATLLFSGCTTTGNYSIAPCRVAPPVIPDNTLVIFIGAAPDLGKWARVPELAQQFNRCGVNSVFLEPWEQLGDHKIVADWIRTAVRCRKQRVMIVAWSYGAVVGLKALKNLEREGICIDTFMEIDCFNLRWHMLGNVKRSNVRRTVVVRSAFNGKPDEYGPCSFHHLEDWEHLASPTNPHTIQVIHHELARIAQMQGTRTEAAPAIPSLQTPDPPLSAFPVRELVPAAVGKSDAEADADVHAEAVGRRPNEI